MKSQHRTWTWSALLVILRTRKTIVLFLLMLLAGTGVVEYTMAPLRIWWWIPLLEHKDERTQTAAVHALMKIGRPIIPKILKLLKSKSPVLRKNAAGCCYGLEDPQIRKALENLIQHDPDALVRENVAYALGYRSFKKSSVTLLVKALSDPSAKVRSASSCVLGRFKSLSSSGLWKLAQKIHDESWLTQICSIKAMGEIGTKEPRILALLKRELLHGNNFLIKQNILDTLFKISPPELGTILYKVLTHKKAKMRMHRRCILEFLVQHEKRYPILMPVLERYTHETDGIQWNAARSLGLLGLSSLPVFKKMFTQNDPGLRYVALYGLYWLNDPVVVPIFQRVMSTKQSESFKIEALRGLCRHRTKVIPTLLKVTQSHNSTVRAIALRILWKLKTPPETVLSVLKKHPKPNPSEIQRQCFVIDQE